MRRNGRRHPLSRLTALLVGSSLVLGTAAPAFGVEAGSDSPTTAAQSGDGSGVVLQLLGINDFHGRLESPGRLDGQPVGGAAQLAGLVDQLRAEHPNTAFVSAGDNIGASTFISAIDGDNPTIDVLNQMGLAVSAVGNHEFDKGIDDLTGRVVDRADFPHLGANVYRGDQRALPAYWVDTLGGVDVGYVGVVTQQTASMVSPDGIAGITFRDPVAEANLVAGQLKDGDPANGEADVVVLLAHEGAENTDSAEALANDPVFGPFTRVDATIDAIFSGHTHLPYAYGMPVPGSDRLRPVIQADSYGRMLGRITLTVDPTAGTVTDFTADVIDVVGVPEDPTVAAMVAEAKAKADVLGLREIGTITGDIRRGYTNGQEDRGIESVLGNFIADVQLAGTRDAGRGGAQIALMNPGGLRADLLYGADGVVSYAEAYAVQPFANDMVTMSLTGAQVEQVLEEQWQPAGASRPVLRLGVSTGLRYRYDPDAARGSRITSITLDGAPVDPAATYRVTVNSFLAAGGDNFTTLTQGTNRFTTGDNDLTMLVDYFAKNSPVTADPQPRRSVRPACTTTITGRHTGPLRVTTGVACLSGATIGGPISVASGASLVASGGHVAGPINASGSARLVLDGTTVAGGVAVFGATGEVTVDGGRVNGPVSITGGTAQVRVDGVAIGGPVRVVNTSSAYAAVIAANTIGGPLACSGNTPAPTDEDRANTVRGPATGQCSAL